MTDALDKALLLKRLHYVDRGLRLYKAEHSEEVAFILGGLKVINELIRHISAGMYDLNFNSSGTETGRFSSSEPNLSAEPKSEPPVVNGHVLYTKEDFKDMTGEKLESSYTAHLVLDGGLSICKICGEGEAGLDNPCKPKKNLNDKTNTKGE
ncbi:hypothetical protein BSP36_178 [Bacillus phage BSP36]|uniref:Uncharacterized protein n=1 Tax=Bacillus phage BSP38 TaxID=2283013 RepID=A0A345MK41_BPBSP|nr:hypothetical protein HWB82_gp137 [Bacillus phage BSP38]AXH71223.1 hypothetical protein BSP38_181 [Bacillus phage BSP38]AYJ75265.1 hypothetical protein BSP36_178 [Bacillus phage BSP36]